MGVDRERTVIAARLALVLLASTAFASAAAAAAVRDYDLPAGSLRTAVTAMGRQAGISISVSDAGLWRRRVPAVKGRMTTREALARMLRGTDARVIEIDAGNIRIAAGTPAVRRADPSPAERDRQSSKRRRSSSRPASGMFGFVTTPVR
jgi:hypothetical protein